MHGDDHDPDSCPCCKALHERADTLENLIRTQSHALAAALQALEKVQELLNDSGPPGGPTPQVGGGRHYF